jgi:hypothetical protein
MLAKPKGPKSDRRGTVPALTPSFGNSSLSRMQYLIARDGQQMGQFSDEEIRSGLFEGRYLPTDAVWTEGMDDWRPLGDVMGQGTTRVASPVRRPEEVPTPSAPERKQPTGIAIAALVLVGVAILASLLFGSVGTMREKRAVATAMATAGTVTNAVKARAAVPEQEGKYPATLEELVTAAVISQELLDQVNAFKPDGWSGEPGFAYHGAGMTDATSAGKPLLTSRSADSKNRRIVVTGDGKLELKEAPEPPPAPAVVPPPPATAPPSAAPAPAPAPAR